MPHELETGDVFRAAYLVSRGARVLKATVQGGDHVSLTLTGEDLDHEDHRYRTAAGLVVPGQILIISRAKLNLCTFLR